VSVFASLPLRLSPSRSETIQRIRSTESDILIFADLGQDCRSFALAHYRLAPYQMALWGWGGTLGIPSIDYYLYPQVFWFKTKCRVSNRMTTPQELFSEQVGRLHLLFREMTCAGGVA
jgi:predicted O-linked N-acetylglucosamine transferase (SPINDLY family)